MTSYGKGPKSVLVIGSLHGDATPSISVTTDLMKMLTTGGAPAGTTVHVIRTANPDGFSNGVRENAHGVDINRNFPTATFEPSPDHGTEPGSEPETRAVIKAIEASTPELVIVGLGTQYDPFVNADGPGVSAGQSIAAALGLPYKASESLVPTPGSIGNWLGNERQVPVVFVAVSKGDVGAAGDLGSSLYSLIGS